MSMTYLLLAVVAFAVFFTMFRYMNRSEGASPSASDADPLAEAEVYLAYGRKQEAIELLQRAMRTHPNRAAIAAKLNEVLDRS